MNKDHDRINCLKIMSFFLNLDGLFSFLLIVFYEKSDKKLHALVCLDNPEGFHAHSLRGLQPRELQSY